MKRIFYGLIFAVVLPTAVFAAPPEAQDITKDPSYIEAMNRARLAQPPAETAAEYERGTQEIIARARALEARIKALEQAQQAKNENFFSDVSVKIVKREGQFIDNGSGTVIGCVPEGNVYACYVITAAHVVRNAKSLEITLFNDGRPAGTKSGVIMGRDTENDIALVKITVPRPIATATVAPEDYVIKSRDFVIAAGCPAGQTPPFVYSDKSACVLVMDRYLGGSNITTSCIPEQGASGGGLYNAKGELIGVCSAHDAREKTGLYVGMKEIYNLINSLKAGITVSDEGVVVKK